MNAKTMAEILGHMDAKSERICMLDEKLRKADEMFRQWKTLLGLSAKLTGPETEDAIKRMSVERTTLETNHKQHVELVNALASCPLPRNAAESNQAYALRVGEALKDAKLQWEQDQRRIAQLEKRDSELNALHDTIEAVPGFPMQAEETLAEYLQRLSADRAFHADESARRFTDLEHLKASTAQTLERLRAQLDQTNLQYTAEREKNRLLTEQLIEVLEELKGMCTSDDLDDARFERDNAREEAKTAIAEREHFRAKWDASLKVRDMATDEARRTRETNEALQGQLTLRSQIIARVMMDPATDKLFNERDWSDAARKVLIDARALCGDTSEANVTPKEHQ